MVSVAKRVQAHGHLQQHADDEKCLEFRTSHSAFSSWVGGYRTNFFRSGTACHLLKVFLFLLKAVFNFAQGCFEIRSRLFLISLKAVPLSSEQLTIEPVDENLLVPVCSSEFSQHNVKAIRMKTVPQAVDAKTRARCDWI